MSKVKTVKDNAERWLLTYADLMNLLLILFILLYTMSKIDIARYQTVAASLRAAFGDASTNQVIGDAGGAPALINIEGQNPSPVVEAQMEEQQMEEIRENISEVINKEGLSGNVDVTVEERGIVISIEEKVLFKSGSADLEPDSRLTIEKIGKVLLAVPGKQIRVEGHTDNVPISTSRFPDNQELSTARANSVWRILVNNVGISPKNLSATGYGEYRPKKPNDTEENRAQNRRVDIAILKDIFDKSESGVESVTPVNESAAAGEAQATEETTIR
ncbi:MAG: flagellar motor protein MotB [Ruminiclostridium sp.]|nr:flagellar motor protein MotB [Ruminiclostridium sp.]